MPIGCNQLITCLSNFSEAILNVGSELLGHIICEFVHPDGLGEDFDRLLWKETAVRHFVVEQMNYRCAVRRRCLRPGVPDGAEHVCFGEGNSFCATSSLHCASFPLLLRCETWKMEKAIGAGDLVNSKGETISMDTLSGKYVGLYFGARWCGPCRSFSVQLVSTYRSMMKLKLPFEIVFVSSDKTEDQMLSYMRTSRMQFVGIPFGDKRQDWLSVRSPRKLRVVTAPHSFSTSTQTRYGVEHLPWMVILSPDGKVLVKNAVDEIVAQEEAVWKLWTDLAAMRAKQGDDQ